MAGFGYTTAHVAEALQRLSMVSAGRAVALPDGSVGVQPQELLERWQVVAQAAAAAGQMELDMGSLQHLQVVLNYVEAVIISCGAPDSFDVYEVCFEVLTKIGFCLPQTGPKELLLRILENVHEVYDVLLSCVETYEWVQPGATGSLRLWMLQVLFACFGARGIHARDLMELTENDVAGAVSLISYVLKCEQAPFEMQSSAGRCLVELTTADAVFMERSGEDLQSQQIKALTQMLNRHVNGLIKGIIQFDVVEAFGRCICLHQMSHGNTDVIMKQFLTTIHNCLLYCSENQKKLRQHLATQSTIVQDIMVPYVNNILPALYDMPGCGPSMIEWQNLKSTLQTFVVVTFNINVFRGQLRDSDMLPAIAQVPGILSHITMLELLVKTAINVDFTKGPHFDALLAAFTAAFQALAPESQARLQSRMSSEQGQRLPFSRSATQATTALLFMLTPPAGQENTPEAVAQRKATKKMKWHKAKNKGKKRKRIFGQQSYREKDQAPQYPDECESDDDSEDDDMPPLMPAEGYEMYLGAGDESGVPTGALCQLSGALMKDPVQTPDGNLFERAALEDWTLVHASNPVTGAPLDIAQCVQATEMQNFIQGYQMSMLSACMIAPEAFDEPPPPMCDAPDPPMAALEPRDSLLGDLPGLQKDAALVPKKKEKGKLRIESRSVIDCPEEMRCAVDGKVMTNPVRSPYGHLFEKKTLEKWMANCGSVCPITGKPLRIDECAQDLEMKKHIVKFLKGQQ
jgi:hypothetical protein